MTTPYSPSDSTRLSDPNGLCFAAWVLVKLVRVRPRASDREPRHLRFILWRETGAFRNARPSRGQAAAHLEEAEVGKDNQLRGSWHHEDDAWLSRWSQEPEQRGLGCRVGGSNSAMKTLP